MKKILTLLTISLLIVSQVFAQCATVTVNNQCIFTDGAPTITLCGTGPTVATGGNSNAATVVIGASSLNQYAQTIPVLQCKVAFATAFTNPPVVSLSTNSLGFRVTVTSVSTTVLIVSFSSNAGGSQFSYSAF